MRRISHLEHINSLKISHEEDLVIALAEPIDISHAQKKRKFQNYCESVMKGKTNLTLSTINLVKNILNLKNNETTEMGTYGKDGMTLI